MSTSFDFNAPDFLTTGAVGPPGERVFFLQARESEMLATLKLEKEQVRALAEYLGELLSRLPPAAEVALGDLALEEPITPVWVVRSLGVGYDQEADRFLIVAEELVEEEETRDPASARFQVSRAQAAALVERARDLMKAGRKPCPICGNPLNPGGHICPRANGHGRD